MDKVIIKFEIDGREFGAQIAIGQQNLNADYIQRQLDMLCVSALTTMVKKELIGPATSYCRRCVLCAAGKQEACDAERSLKRDLTEKVLNKDPSGIVVEAKDND